MATREEQRAYQRGWLRRRRREWIEANGPCVDCGQWTADLEVDHADARTKITHNVWSWSAERRSAELAKCVVRCNECHKVKSNPERPRSVDHPQAVLPAVVVAEIRRRWSNGERQVDLAHEYGVSRQHVYDLVHRRTRAYE